MQIDMPASSHTTRRRFGNSRGQGIVEYILLIVVVISLALAVSAQFFKPFNEWARNYIGDYITCLLDQGELPSLGGGESVSDCDKDFQNASFGSGRPPKGGSGSGDDSEEKGGRGRLGKTAGGSGSSGSGSSSLIRSRRSSNIGAGFDGDAGSRSSKITNVSDQMGLNRKIVNSGRGGSSVISSDPRAIKANGFTGMLAQEQERIKKREQKVTVARSSDRSVAFVRGKTKIMAVEPRKSRKGDFDITAGDWSLGGIVRIAFIIAIIIALVLFVGGQMMQISKSMEKE